MLVALGTLVFAAVQKAPLDLTGDHVTDFVVVRNTGGGPTGAVTWWVSNTLNSTFFNQNWGIASDFFVAGDFDGDNIGDIVIWRPGTGGAAGFWILPSSTGIGFFTAFGQTGDDPSVVGDYDGDGKTDLAVYRSGSASGDASNWFYKRSIDGVIVQTTWGLNGDFPAPGDYDGDGRNDFAIQRNGGGGAAMFWFKMSTAGISNTFFGTPTDVIVPGDYDGDGKTDIAIVRGAAGALQWWIKRSSDGTIVAQSWGASATDFTAQGDYDGDGRTDFAIWRPSATPGASAFWVIKSSTGATLFRAWGANGDFPVARFNAH
jgi:hypothetical protein